MKRLLVILLLLSLIILPVSAANWTISGSDRYVNTSGVYTIVKFNVSTPVTWNVPEGVLNVSYLVVAGGGGGGAYQGGGGGAGGVVYNGDYSVSGSYTITFGSGGTGSSIASGTSGGNSSFGTIVAIGGGGGGISHADGLPGGSGGGGGTGNAAGDADYISPRQGYDGGAGGPYSGKYMGGGGGGASEVGVAGATNKAGDGGDGTSYASTFGTIIGVNGYVGGGGGGSGYQIGANEFGLGGLGGGGDGGAGGGNNNGAAGTSETGGGGGSGHYQTGVGSGGNGGTGVVILKYAYTNKPISNFTSDVTSGYAPLTVQFTDTSYYYTPTSWNWSFGDGTFSTEQNPTHTYNSVIGSTQTKYDVHLGATNANGTSWKNVTEYITMNPVGTSFNANITYGSSTLVVQFYDNTTGSPTAWNWSFGDGTYSNDQNPIHSYTTTSTFDVSLNASNSKSFSTKTETDYIMTVTPGDMTGFSAVEYFTIYGSPTWNESQTDYQISLTIYNVTGTSTGNIVYLSSFQKEKNWGDLRFTSGDAGNHIFDYWIESTTTNSAKVWVEVGQIPRGTNTTVKIWANNAGASSASSGKNTFLLFDDFSTLNTSLWDTTGSPSVVSGHLTLYNGDSIRSKTAYGVNTTVRTFAKMIKSSSTVGFGFIGPSSDQYAANMISYPTSGEVQFISYASASSYSSVLLGDIPGVYLDWEYEREVGRNSSSTNDFVWHAQSFQTTAGIPTMDMDVWFAMNLAGGNTLTADFVSLRKEVYPNPVIMSHTGLLPEAHFTASKTDGIAPFYCQFTDTSTGNPTNWYWDFGDGETSTLQSPNHRYVRVGIFNVSFKSYNINGESWSNSTYLIGSATRSDFQYVATVNLTNPSGVAQTDYQMNFILVNGTGTNTSNKLYTQSTNSIGTTIFVQHGDNCKYWIEEINATATSVWIKVPEIAADNTSQLSIYWGNGTYRSRSNGFDTFMVFDDFETGTLEHWMATYGAAWNVNTNYPKHGSYSATVVVNDPDQIDTIIYSLPAQAYEGDTISRGWFKTNSEGSTTCAAGYIGSFYYGYSGWDFAMFSTGIRYELADATTEFVDYSPTISYPHDGTTWTKYAAGKNRASGHQYLYINDIYSGSPTDYYTWHTMGIPGTLINETAKYYCLVVTGSSWTGANQQFSIDSPSISKWVYPEPGASGWVPNGVLPPITIWTSDITSGNVSFDVVFNDTSTEQPTSYFWDFGDGSTSTDKNPTHTYTVGGNYTINHSASNIYGTTWENVTDYITANDPVIQPVAAFSGTPTSGVDSAHVHFTDASTNEPTSWYWDFGDTTTSTAQNPEHDFGVGTYTISLRATNTMGSDWENKTNYITVTSGGTSPVAAFSGTPTTGTTTAHVHFTDSSSNTPTSWYWSFGDGNTSTTQNPEHDYYIGTFTVSMRASNGYGNDWENKSGYIVVSSEPTPTPTTPTPTTSPTPTPIPTPIPTLPSGLPPYDGILTIGSSNPQINAITLDGWVNSTHDVWFRWGSSTQLPIITTILPDENGNFSITLTDQPFIKDQTYYFAAGCYDGYGSIESFVLPGADPVPITTYSNKLTQFTASKNNFTALAEVVGSVYTDRWGMLFYGIIWLAIIGAVWLRTEDIKIPLMAYILLSGALNISSLMPANMVYFVYATMVLAAGALFYSLFKKRQE